MIGRFAIYAAPGVGSADPVGVLLRQRAEQWLGRSVSPNPVTPGTPPGWTRAAIDAMTANARRYGFHATLKPPFRLAEGRAPEELDAAVARFAASSAAAVIPRLTLARLGGFFALVPGARALVEAIQERGLRLYLASGTDQQYMREEAGLLDMARYFDGRVYGALDDYKSFSKKILIQRLIATSEFQGTEFLGFGDGYVEIENIKEVGGVAVGVATAEPECRTVDEWKRLRLAGVGADFIVPNFLCRDELLRALFPNGQ